MKGLYTIEIDGNKIDLYFKYWSLCQFSERNGNLSLGSLLELLGDNAFTPSQYADLLLCAAEYKFVKEGKQFPYTLFDAKEWIDEIGGIAGTAFLEIVGLLAKTINDPGAKENKKKAGK